MKKYMIEMLTAVLLLTFLVAWQLDIERSYKNSSSVLVTEIFLMQKEINLLLHEKRKLELDSGSSGFEASMASFEKISLINKRGRYLLSEIKGRRESLIGMKIAMSNHALFPLTEGTIISDPEKIRDIEESLMPWKIKDPWH